MKINFEDGPPPDRVLHLEALRQLTGTLDKWATALAVRVDETSKRKDLAEHQLDQVIDLFYENGFVELCRGHALVCTLTAFLESLFKDELPALEPRLRGAVPADHPRAKRFVTNPSAFWDPEKREQNAGIVDTVVVILKATKLIGEFGPQFDVLMRALFAYRNNMVHLGFEWPMDERRTFQRKIANENWDAWFDIATSGADPWFFTTTAAFREAAVELCWNTFHTLERLRLGDELFAKLYGDAPI